MNPHRTIGPLLALLTVLAWFFGCGEGKPSVRKATTTAPARHRYSVVFPTDPRTIEMTDDLRRWRDSLVRNIHHRGNVHVFLRTCIVLFDAGAELDSCVFQNPDKPSQFLVLPPGGRSVIVDRARKEVGTMGVAGITLHPHPDGHMVVCLEPAPGTGILGVCLSDSSKTGAANHRFEGSETTWTW